MNNKLAELVQYIEMKEDRVAFLNIKYEKSTEIPIVTAKAEKIEIKEEDLKEIPKEFNSEEDEILYKIVEIPCFSLTDNIEEALIEAKIAIYNEARRHCAKALIISENTLFSDQLSQLKDKYDIIYTKSKYFPEDAIIVLAYNQSELPITRVYKSNKSKIIINPLLVKKIMKRTI